MKLNVSSFDCHRPDPETEERAQRAIEQFFASNMIAPSPWSDPKSRKKKAVLATPSSSQASKVELVNLRV